MQWIAVSNGQNTIHCIIQGAFDQPYSGIRMHGFTSKNHVYKNFNVIGIQLRFAALFPDNIFLRNPPAFNSKEKFEGYSIYSYSRIRSIERGLNWFL